jgi:hypothetical protein
VAGVDEAQRTFRRGDQKTSGGINARPQLQFKLRLAGHLGKTLAEIDQMDSREFSTWIAYARWFRPLSDPWLQTGMMISASLAPYSKHKPPSADEFIPVDSMTPQHPIQVQEKLRQLAEAMKATQ